MGHGYMGAPRALAAAFVCLAGAASPAAAEEAGRVIEEVLVTAEKREATVQETSLAITAYDQEALDLRGIDEIEDLQFSAPNLVISHNSQSPVSYAYIRGIGSDQLVAGFDPGVAYHVDGIYVGQPSSMPVDLWDMERVEVLRGPQGTLYGRNTTGGSINVITADPTDELTGKADLAAGDYERFRARGAISGPLTERVAGRLSAIFDTADGFQDNLIGDDADSTDHYAVRGKLRFDLSEAAELVLTAQRFENEGNQGQKRRESFDGIPAYTGAIPNPGDPRKVAKDHDEELDLENSLLAARLTWDFELGALGPVQLVSNTGYIENEWFQTMDIDMSSLPIQHQDWEMDTEQFTQELQLVSAGSGPWDWILGFFYFDESLSTDYFFQDVLAFTFFNGGDLDTESIAYYGQASYDFRDAGLPVRVVGGLRYTQDEKDIDEYQRIPEFLVDAAGASDESWDEWSGKVGLDWFLSEDVMAYASFSHGYKGGGFSIGQFDTYDPEKVDAVEVGIKSQLYNNRAQVNLAAFYYDYQDLQVNFLLFTSFTTDNAAEATIKGFELETTLLATEQLTLNANLTWLNAEFDDYVFSTTPLIDLAGDELNRSPAYTAALSAQYDWPLGESGTVTARLDYYWQDEMYLRVQNIPRHKADSFYTADARVMWTSADGRWAVDGFCKNCTDEDNQRGLTVSDGLSTGNSSFVSYYPPRTWGVRVGYSIGS